MDLILEFRSYKLALIQRLDKIKALGKEAELQDEVEDIQFYMSLMKDIHLDRTHGEDLVRNYIGKIHELTTRLLPPADDSEGIEQEENLETADNSSGDATAKFSDDVNGHSRSQTIEENVDKDKADEFENTVSDFSFNEDQGPGSEQKLRTAKKTPPEVEWEWDMVGTRCQNTRASSDSSSQQQGYRESYDHLFSRRSDIENDRLKFQSEAADVPWMRKTEDHERNDQLFVEEGSLSLKYQSSTKSGQHRQDRFNVRQQYSRLGPQTFGPTWCANPEYQQRDSYPLGNERTAGMGNAHSCYSEERNFFMESRKEFQPEGTFHGHWSDPYPSHDVFPPEMPTEQSSFSNFHSSSNSYRYPSGPPPRNQNHAQEFRSDWNQGSSRGGRQFHSRYQSASMGPQPFSSASSSVANPQFQGNSAGGFSQQSSTPSFFLDTNPGDRGYHDAHTSGSLSVEQQENNRIQDISRQKAAACFTKSSRPTSNKSVSWADQGRQQQTPSKVSPEKVQQPPKRDFRHRYWNNPGTQPAKSPVAKKPSRLQDLKKQLAKDGQVFFKLGRPKTSTTVNSSPSPPPNDDDAMGASDEKLSNVSSNSSLSDGKQSNVGSINWSCDDSSKLEKFKEFLIASSCDSNPSKVMKMLNNELHLKDLYLSVLAVIKVAVNGLADNQTGKKKKIGKSSQLNSRGLEVFKAFLLLVLTTESSLEKCAEFIGNPERSQALYSKLMSTIINAGEDGCQTQEQEGSSSDSVLCPESGRQWGRQNQSTATKKHGDEPSPKKIRRDNKANPNLQETQQTAKKRTKSEKKASPTKAKTATARTNVEEGSNTNYDDLHPGWGSASSVHSSASSNGNGPVTRSKSRDPLSTRGQYGTEDASNLAHDSTVFSSEKKKIVQKFAADARRASVSAKRSKRYKKLKRLIQGSEAFDPEDPLTDRVLEWESAVNCEDGEIIDVGQGKIKVELDRFPLEGEDELDPERNEVQPAWKCEVVIQDEIDLENEPDPLFQEPLVGDHFVEQSSAEQQDDDYAILPDDGVGQNEEEDYYNESQVPVIGSTFTLQAANSVPTDGEKNSDEI